MDRNSHKILLVEDDALIALAEKKQLEQYGYNTVAVLSGEKAVEIVKTDESVDLILMDIDLGSGMDGTQAAYHILQIKEIPVIFLSSHTEPEIVDKTEKISSYGYVVKSTGITVLDASIKMAYKLFNARKKIIKHKKRSENNLDKMQAVIQTAMHGFWLTDGEGIITDVNEAYCSMSGYSRDEILGKHINNFDAIENPDDTQARIRYIRAEGESLFESVHRRKDGSEFDVEISVQYKNWDEDCLVVFLHDISDLKHSRKRFENMFNFSPVPLWEEDFSGVFEILESIKARGVTDLGQYFSDNPDELLRCSNATRVTDVNQAAIDLHRAASRDELLGSLDKIFTRNSLVSFREELVALGNGAETYTLEGEVRTLDGEIRQVLLTLNVESNPGGLKKRVFISTQDITESKQAECLRRDYVQFLENLERIDQAFKKAGSYQEALEDVVHCVFDIFGCDRAFLLSPAESSENFFNIPVLITNPRYPGNTGPDRRIEINEAYSNMFDKTHSSAGPVTFGPGNEYALDTTISERFSIKSRIIVSLHPKNSPFWTLGLHQCSHARVWTDQEKRLFSEIGRRITDGLNSLIIMRNLKDSEEKFRTLAQLAPVGIYMTNVKGICQYANPMWKEISGLTDDMALGRGWSGGIHPEDRERVQNSWHEYSARQESRDLEYRFINQQGTVIWIRELASPFYDSEGKFMGYIGINTDISDRKSYEREIISQLSEKEILLKEVHHRIKNNFANIENLLSLQSESKTHPEAVLALQEALGRVSSFRILYDELLLEDNYKTGAIKNYLENLIEKIASLYDPEKRIQLETHIDDFTLDSHKIVSLGIIANELLTNVFKYAYAGKESGLVSIRVKGTGGSKTLCIADNGTGIPDSRMAENKKGFGLMLVNLLARQLGGTFTISSDKGTECTVRFSAP